MTTENKEIAVSPLEVDSTALEAVMKGEAEKRALITKYISVHMKSGTDYGTIKFGNKESKPSLFKPGSEKFLSLFKLTAQFEKDTDTWEMAGSEAGVFSYKCRLLDSKKRLVGEGRGVSKLSEKQGWTINNAVKIAEKRAQIDAVLRTGALSDFFTQDLEDMQPQQYDQSPIKADAVPVVTYDDHEEPVKSAFEKPWQKPLASAKSVVNEKKRRIMELVEAITLHPLDKTAEAYQTWVFDNTELLLTEANYDAIISKLTQIKAGEI